ncbi:restriction endonuclease subunit S [Streptomyces sp. NPDC005389]|uniref:restriction endonuclease subunit S n=1 Tax=Streptomyces sp. NPDC005389 TaxID=3157040 RepID=UPI0033B06F85
MLLAPDHVEPRTGKIIKQESAADQGASSGKYAVQPGDVIFSKIRPALRKVALADFFGTCSADMYPLRPGEEITAGFLSALLLSEGFSRYAESLSGRTGIPKVNRSDLAGYHFPLPPMEEQLRIVEVIDAVSAQERTTEASIAKLKSVRAGTSSAMLDEFAWDHTLVDATDDAIRNGFSPVESEVWTGVQMLGLGCLTSAGFEPAQLKNAPSFVAADHAAMLRDGDLLMSRANTRELVGLAGVYRDVGSPCIYPDLMMRIRPSRNCAVNFLAAVLMSSRTRRYVRSAAQGTSESMVKISANAVRRIPVPLPSLDEQARVLAALSSLSRQVDAEVGELAKLQALKRGLVDDLLAGRA